MSTSSAFVFASDLAAEGAAAVLDNVEHRAGLGGVTAAFVYHAARDICPHNPRQRVVHQERGAFYFRPDERLYAGQLVQPVVSALAREHDVLAETCRLAADRGLAVKAWTVFLHPDRVGEFPSCAPVNAFGDRYEADFCPANPDVRAYVRTLVADVSRYELESILAESLHYHGLEHGYHHERYFVSLDPTVRFLLSLCFCDHCLAAARRAEVDAAHVHATVRLELERALTESAGADSHQPTRETLAGVADGELLGYLDARTETVSTLVADASATAESHGRKLVFLELSGAVKGYATGLPVGGPAAEISWRLGVDLARLAPSCHGVEIAGYAADPARLELDFRAYKDLLGEGSAIGVALRPSPPDCDGPANLAAKLSLLRSLGASSTDFYHYGLVRLEALDWVRTAREASIVR